MVSHDGANFVQAADRPFISALVQIADPGYSSANHGVLVGTAQPGVNGIIGPVPPPDYLASKTVSECNQYDAVCQGYVLGGAVVHTTSYRDPVLQTIAAELVRQKIFGASTTGSSTSSLDLVFAIDTTGSMGPYISSAVSSASAVVSTLQSKGIDFRIGVVDYKDADGCGDYDAVTDLQFSNDVNAIQNALSSLQSKVYGGCDTPEDVYSGIERALNFPWRNGVKKVIIQMGDAPGKDPEPHSGLTLASITAHAKAVDPAIVDPILIGSDTSAHQFDQNIAAATGGQTFDATGDPSTVGKTIVDAVGSIADASDGDLEFLNTPGHMFVDATSPSGAVVSFDLPKVSDGSDASPPTPICDASPSGLTSGSMFPIGDAMVTCTVTDPDDAPSTIAGTFEVTIEGASAQLQDLLMFVDALAPGSSLSAKVRNIIDNYAAAHHSAACGTLNALINEAQAQSGKHLTSAQAAGITTAATRIGAVMAC